MLATERSGDFTTPWGYSIDVANGTYLVDLFYAEIYHGLVTTGDPDDKRQFDVLIEGALVEDDYDIIDDAGAAGALATRSYTVEVTDGALDIEFLKQIDQAKLSGLAVWAVGGSVAPPSDGTAPVVASITVANPQGVQDDVRGATVVLTDAGGFDAAALAALDGSELTFTGIEPAAVSAPSVSISDDGRTATLSYALTPPEAGWPAGEGEVSVAQGAYADAAGNVSGAASGAFIFEPNLANLVAGQVALAINVGPVANAVDGSLAGDDKSTYGGAIANDPIIGVSLQADDPSYYSPSSKTGSNIDGLAGTTGSNPALDGSALHTYRDSAAGSFTATYPIENGVYVVELWFAELFHATPGQRQGDYVVNGQVAELNFDAHTVAGGADTPVKITKNVTVTDGQLVVEVSADTGQPGFNAIVVYEAVPSDLPPTISVSDASAVEGGEATVVFTRVGDLDQAVEVSFALTPGGADAADYAAPASGSVIIAAGESSASIVVPIVDDEEEEGPRGLQRRDHRRLGQRGRGRRRGRRDHRGLRHQPRGALGGRDLRARLRDGGRSAVAGRLRRAPRRLGRAGGREGLRRGRQAPGLDLRRRSVPRRCHGVQERLRASGRHLGRRDRAGLPHDALRQPVRRRLHGRARARRLGAELPPAGHRRRHGRRPRPTRTPARWSS